MRDTQNITIVLLLITAAVLAAVLVVARDTTSVAYADTSVRGGDYIMVTGAWSSTRDILYVVDAAEGKLIAYTANTNTNVLEPLDSRDLEQLFRQARRPQRP
ncbi:MAG: hypothetical protein KAU28_08050 [Phycisphaerae bacterium]|nr:hypothetical protein [Phycisphaerae bacterium]